MQDVLHAEGRSGSFEEEEEEEVAYLMEDKSGGSDEEEALSKVEEEFKGLDRNWEKVMSLEGSEVRKCCPMKERIESSSSNKRLQIIGVFLLFDVCFQFKFNKTCAWKGSRLFMMEPRAKAMLSSIFHVRLWHWLLLLLLC